MRYSTPHAVNTFASNGGVIFQTDTTFISPNISTKSAEDLGFRLGAKGTHTSRTMMLSELTSLLNATTSETKRSEYASLIVAENILFKDTTSTRKLTNQRLGELYGLDPSLSPFRVLRSLWSLDKNSQPQLALLMALARDPLLMGTAAYIISMKPGDELSKVALKNSISEVVQGRLNDDILDKVARNIASSWTQSEHLIGRTFKIRNKIKPTYVSLSFALYLGRLAGVGDEELIRGGWVKALDCDPLTARELAFEAKRLGLIDVKAPDNKFLEYSFNKIDPWKRGGLSVEN